MMDNQTLYGIEDDLVMNEDVGTWTAEKYRQLQLYAHQFTRSMKGKWKSLTYLDLYAGAGQSRVSVTREILLGSPLIALSLDVQFDQYVFCEKHTAKLLALEQRVKENFSNANVQFVKGDCDDPAFQLGESGPRSRPLQVEWVRSLQVQCEQAGVAFFFKQWGGTRKKIAGRLLDGHTYDQFPARLEGSILPERQRLAYIRKYSSTKRVDISLVSLVIA